MRIGYSDDEEYPGQFNLWQANCKRSLKGRAGQKALRELEAALLALPTKRLVHAEFDNGYDVCAIGALARAKGITPTADPEFEMEDVGVECGMPRLVAWKVVEQNDIQFDGHYKVLEGPTKQFRYLGAGGGCGSVFVPYTPEERYERVLHWVREQLGVSRAGAEPAQ